MNFDKHNIYIMKKLNCYNIFIIDISNLLKNKHNLNYLYNEMYINNFKYDLSKNTFKLFSELWIKLSDNTKNKYKRINNYDEYLNIVKKNNEDYIYLYVDGSYRKTELKYSYAFVLVKDSKIIYERCNIKKEPVGNKIEHIAGELKAVIEGIRYIKFKKYKNINVHYDFQGIADLALLDCKPRNETTKRYKNFIKKNMKILNIIFTKVKSHSGNIFNERVDKLCKHAFIVKYKKRK